MNLRSSLSAGLGFPWPQRNEVGANRIDRPTPKAGSSPADLRPGHTLVAPTSIFHEEWWLRLASKGECQTVAVQKDGKTVGALPFVATRRYGMTYVQTPPYTRLLGPALVLPPSKISQRIRNTRSIVKGLVEQLPSFDYYYHCAHYDAEIAFAFSLHGFDVRQTYSFVAPATEKLAVTWRNLDQKTRNLVRSASARLTCKTSLDFDDFVTVSRNEHQTSNSNDFTVMRALFAECAARQQGIVLTAYSDSGQTLVAAAVLVWGHGTAYFWISARDRSEATVGANALLIWQGIEFAHEHGLDFDLDGYRSIGSAKFLSGFGLPPVARVEITRSSLRYDAFVLAKAMIRRVTG